MGELPPNYPDWRSECPPHREGLARLPSYEHIPIAASLPLSTQWHRSHGRQSRKEKAIKQQLLTPLKEQAIVDYALRADRNGYPARVKDSRRHCRAAPTSWVGHSEQGAFCSAVLYRHAREAALTARTIRSGWSGTGLFPSNPDRVLTGMEAPREANVPPLSPPRPTQELTFTDCRTLETPITTAEVHDLYRMLEAKLEANSSANDLCLQKLLHATEKAFAECSL